MNIGENMIEYAATIEALRLVQNTIARLAGNSFKLKGWTVTVVVLAMALSDDIITQYVAFVPTLMFWLLDSYYLHQERLFRRLHASIVENSSSDFSNIFNFDLSKFKKKFDYMKAATSVSEIGFYLPIAALTFVLIFKLR